MLKRSKGEVTLVAHASTADMGLLPVREVLLNDDHPAMWMWREVAHGYGANPERIKREHEAGYQGWIRNEERHDRLPTELAPLGDNNRTFLYGMALPTRFRSDSSEQSEAPSNSPERQKIQRSTNGRVDQRLNKGNAKAHD
jgi:hypothetical protein